MHAWLSRVLDFEALDSFHYSMVLKRNFQVFFHRVLVFQILNMKVWFYEVLDFEVLYSRTLFFKVLTALVLLIPRFEAAENSFHSCLFSFLTRDEWGNPSGMLE